MQKDKLTVAREQSKILLDKFMCSKCQKEKTKLRAEIHEAWDTIRLLKLETKISSIP
jgi:hypothetical protein